MSELDDNTTDNIDNNNEEIPQIEAPIKIKKPVSPEKLELPPYGCVSHGFREQCMRLR